jgi:tetratricopeptide (TPR) repeat protein
MYKLDKKIANILIALVCACYGLCVEAQGNSRYAIPEGELFLGTIDSTQNEKQKLIMNAKKSSFEGKNDEAIKLYQQAIELDPECDACYYELANIYLLMNNYNQAKQMAEMMYKLDTENRWFTLLYGRLCFHFKEYDKAQNLFRKLLRKHGGKQEIWQSLISSYEEQGLFAEALGVLDSMSIRFGENDEISFRIFNIAMDAEKYEKAVSEVQKLVTKYPDDPRFATLLADTYFEMGKDSLAIDTYNKAIKANDSFAPALLGKAEALRKKGMFSQYFKALQAYIANKDIKPDAKAEYLELVMKIPSFANYFKNNIDTIFAITASIHPTSMDLKYTQARYFILTKRPELSISLLGMLTDMDSNNKDAWIGLLSLEYSLKMYNQLEQSSKKAIASDPEYATFYMYSALALFPQNKTKTAIEILEKGIGKANSDSVFLDNALALLGDLYFSIKKPKKAFACYDKALKNNPNNATVLNNYAYYLCLTKSKDLDKAYDMSKKAIELESSNSSFLDTFAYILFLQGKYVEAKTMFRQAMAAGGDESAVVLDHYADTLNKLGEHNTAEIYWSQALDKQDCANPDEIKKKLKRN